jgi:outer membrane protein OmpA-like peptidoglycan-associated protein
MIRNSILWSVGLGSVVWCAAALAQGDTTAASAAIPSATAAPEASAASSGDDVIHLHMPARHRATRATPPAKPAENPTVDAIGADTSVAASPAPSEETPVPAPAPATAKSSKSSHKGGQQPAPAIPFNFGEDSAAPSPPSSPQKASEENATATQDARTASLPPEASVPQSARALAKAAPVSIRKNNNSRAGLTKRGAVLFDKGVSNPSAAQFNGVRLLASDVSTALEAGAARVQLEAYGGTPGDKSSEARRLSLKRALAVRQLLIDDGIPSNRIDVRAMGGVEDKGPNDRVDVFLRAS